MRNRREKEHDFKKKNEGKSGLMKGYDFSKARRFKALQPGAMKCTGASCHTCPPVRISQSGFISESSA